MPTTRMFLTVVLLLATGNEAFAQRRPRGPSGKRGNQPQFQPGMNETLHWVPIQNIKELMEQMQRPTMVYFYNPEDLQMAYRIEAGLFTDSRVVRQINKAFLCIRINSTREEDLGPEQWHVPANRTGLLFLDYDGNPIGTTLLKPPSRSYFRKIIKTVFGENVKRLRKAQAPKKEVLEAPEAAAKTKRPKHKAVSLMDRGKAAFAARCGAAECHAADKYPPQNYTRKQWIEIMHKMSTDHDGEKVELTSGDQTAILFYLMANSKK